MLDLSICIGGMIQITGESQDHTFLIGVRYLGQTAILLLFMRNKLFK